MLNEIILYLNKKEYITVRYSIFFNRFYFIRNLLFKGIEKNKSYISGKILDFGCGFKPYKDIFQNQETYIGVDYEETRKLYNSADVYYDGKVIPFDDNFFDSFICSEVLEHVFDIGNILSEIKRVVKPDGYGIITIPFGRDEHEIPYDFGRYTYLEGIYL